MTTPALILILYTAGISLVAYWIGNIHGHRAGHETGLKEAQLDDAIADLEAATSSSSDPQL